ncbi:MAG: glycogen debranching N-terminal domain-containing protein [Desulfotomaculales bacterium]
MLDITYYGETVNAPLAVEVLKDGELFVTSQPNGEITSTSHTGLGLYYRDTRFLSCLKISLDGQPAVFLSSSIRESHFAQFELTNPALERKDSLVPAQTLHIRVLRVLDSEAMLQRLRLINFNARKIDLRLEMELGADFLDIFEIRGFVRERRGEFFPPAPAPGGVLFGYRGLDGVRRYTRVTFSPRPEEVVIEGSLARARFFLELPPGKKVYVYMEVRLAADGNPEASFPKGRYSVAAVFRSAVKKKYHGYQQWKEECASFASDNLILAQMLQRTITDLYALRTFYPGLGTIVQAGVPWYAAPFGRDALIVGWQTLLINPEIARETLFFLAGLQGKEDNPWRDEEPGKILHEFRRGELASCGEIPHTPYYGSVDATLLFIILLAEASSWTGDRRLVEKLAPNLERALQWCREYGDADGDGFIEYNCRSAKGLVNQGWKDSWDGVIDADGSIPKGPVALVEVQAYYYLALLRAAELFRAAGRQEAAADAEGEAASLRQKFLKAFWLEEEEFLAFALDGNKKPLRTPVSNAGQCLFTGILPPEKACAVARRLFGADMYSGWGIRTMSKAVRPYNPMSYHNGSVWPHDNAIIACGLRTLNLFNLLEQLITNLFEAAVYFPYYRLPEVFCGFTRRQEGGPVFYPTACNPQAWAVGTIPFLVRIMLGITCRGQEVHISKPFLPSWVGELVIRNLQAGSGRADLEFARKMGKTYCSVLRTTGDVRVIIET